MVIDTSAIVAMLQGESDRRSPLEAIEAGDAATHVLRKFR